MCHALERARQSVYSCDVQGLGKGGFPGVFVRCQKLPEICNLFYGFWISAANAPKMTEIARNLPETSDWGPQSDVSGKFPVIFHIFGAFPAEIQNPQISQIVGNFRHLTKTPGKPPFTSPFTSQDWRSFTGNIRMGPPIRCFR